MPLALVLGFFPDTTLSVALSVSSGITSSVALADGGALSQARASGVGAEEPLLQDAANATLQSETLRRNCVRCHNRKWWCKITIKKGAKRLRWRMHQTRFRF